MSEWGSFVPAHIVPYLPHDIVKSLQSQVGGMNWNLPTLLVWMSKLSYPPIVSNVEESHGHPSGGKLECVSNRHHNRCGIGSSIAYCCPTMASWLRGLCHYCSQVDTVNWTLWPRTQWSPLERQGRYSTNYIGISTLIYLICI
jgi:hypothetical protein